MNMLRLGGKPKWVVVALIGLGLLGVALIGYLVFRWFDEPDQNGRLHPVFDEGLDAAVMSAASDNASTPFREMTDFSWSTVSVFPEHVSPDTVLAETGLDLLDSHYVQSRTLLVFCENGAIVRMVALGPPPLQAIGQLTFSNKAVLGPNPQGNLYGLREPSGEHITADCIPGN